MALTYDDVVAIIKGIDSPANGIAMEMNTHRSFDEFEISLIPTESISSSNMYDCITERITETERV
jgi:hypothetical protein